MQGLPGLVRLDLERTRVESLVPLWNARKLERLELAQTPVTDLQPLQRLTRLTTLGLDRTAVADLGPLAKMTELRRLGLARTRVTDLAPLAARYVKIDALDWQPTRFPGIDVKVLMRDDDRGLMTALFRWQPGAFLPDHVHVDLHRVYDEGGDRVVDLRDGRQWVIPPELDVERGLVGPRGLHAVDDELLRLFRDDGVYDIRVDGTTFSPYR